MKLRLFSEETRQEWIEAGHNKVKITGAEHLSVNDLADEKFVLLEPWADLPDSLADGDLAEQITSPIVDDIIQHKSGRFYQ